MENYRINKSVINSYLQKHFNFKSLSLLKIITKSLVWQIYNSKTQFMTKQNMFINRKMGLKKNRKSEVQITVSKCLL